VLVSDESHPIADSLLEPLLDSAAGTLLALEPAELPLALRPLQGFDRRGLAHTPAQRKLRRALEDDEGFRKRVLEQFLERTEAAAVLERWSPAAALAEAEDADGRGDLPLLASVLWAARPEGFEYGLGIVVALSEGRRREGDARSEAEAERRAREAAVEAQRRAEDARQAAEDQLAKTTEQLRDTRADRRAREERASSETAAERRRAEALAAELERQQAAHDELQRRTSGEAKRARDLEDEVRRLRGDLARAADAASAHAEAERAGLPAREARRLSEAASTARRLAEALDELLARAESPAPTPPPPAPQVPGAAAPVPSAPRLQQRIDPGTPADRPLERRMSPALPAGLVADSAAGIAAMVRDAGVVLVVDGYNITKLAWPDASLADQRERLAQRLAALHARCGCESIVVFDGAGAVGIPALRRPGLRVLFSDPGVEADEVVVREVADLPKRVPVVVASSDAWVREHAEGAGAAIVSADTLLELLRTV
jgi:predicted RNA-binding protein with PIN domain